MMLVSTAGADADAARQEFANRLRPTSPQDATRLLGEIYGIEGTALRLSSELDETFAVSAAGGRRFVLKIASPAERREVLDFQGGALLHLAETAPDMPVPRLLPTLAGEHCHTLAADGGAVRFMRLLSYLEGRQLSDTSGSPAQLNSLGRRVGQLDRALATYRPNLPDIDLLWDVSRADRLMPLLGAVDDPARRRLAAAALERFCTEIGPIAGDLPRQVIHNDINPYNVLVDGNDPERVTGLIDFGDLIGAPRINEVAIALSYHIGKPSGFELARAFLTGYLHQVRLEEIELEALGTLIATRLAMTVVITEWRSKQRPDNATYILRNHPAALTGLQRLQDVGPGELRNLLAGHEP